jgi:hypothetical protein
MSEDVTRGLIHQVYTCRPTELQRLAEQAFAHHEQGRMYATEYAQFLAALDQRTRLEAATSKSNK